MEEYLVADCDLCNNKREIRYPCGSGVQIKSCPKCNPEVKKPVEQRTKTCTRCNGEGMEMLLPHGAKVACSNCGGSGRV